MRKTIIFQVTDEGRDKGKSFILTEMPAAQGEKWAMRALLAVAHSGIELPDEIDPQMGLAALAVLGIRALAKVSWIEAEPLLDEMMACIKMQPDPANPDVIRMFMDEDTEEVLTRLKLREEIFKLHTGFSLPVRRPT